MHQQLIQAPSVAPPCSKACGPAVKHLPTTAAEVVAFVGANFVARESTDRYGNALPAECVTYTLTAEDLLTAFNVYSGGAAAPAPAIAAPSAQPAATGARTDIDSSEGPYLADALCELFRESGATNYLEIALDTEDDGIGELMLTIQRRKGKTPHQLRLEAESRLAEAAVKVAHEVTQPANVLFAQIQDEFEKGLASLVSNMSTGLGESGEVSYVEMTLNVPDPEIGKLVMCLRRIGEKSPHALYLEAKNELAQWRERALGMPGSLHADDRAVDRFARVLKEKLARARGKGRSGWEDPRQCSVEWLQELLVEHLAKGDLVDVANFCMMLHQRGAPHLVVAASLPHEVAPN